MKALPILVLLSSALLELCRAAPGAEPVTCSEDSGAAAARLGVRHINMHHEHGYKFRLNETIGTTIDKVEEGCTIELQLGLLETKCHIVNPKDFEDCEVREMVEQAVKANCTVTMAVKNNDAKVTKYECDTQQASLQAMMHCPDCPRLIPLNSPEGLESVDKAVGQFNRNTTNHHYYTLLEVGRIRSGYIMNKGMSYYAEFALVETRCPMGSRIMLEACKPLCPDRAHHAFCSSSYNAAKELESVECEFYPPTNTTALGPGEQEPVCKPPHSHGQGPPPHSSDQGPPPHARGQGPPPHARGQGPPPHARGQGPPPHSGDQGPPPHARGQGPPPHARGQGPPPHARGKGQGPPPHAHDQGTPPGQKRKHHRHPFLPCYGLLTTFDPALHPICPWPVPEPRPNPKLNQS